MENINDANILESVKTFLNTIVENVAVNEVAAQILPKVDSIIQEKYGVLPQIHKVQIDSSEVTLKETVHEKFDEVLKLTANHIPVYLSGEAGTGKNVLCKQIAKALNLDFYFTNAVTQEYKLTGFIDANGTFHETQFYKAFTNGGLFFLDEMDASIPETLITLNAAIANGYFDFPTGKIEAHKDFYVIAAGNTTGTGADEAYTGRFALDKASLDRFALINIGYSINIERSLCNNDKDLVSFVHAFRRACIKAQVKCICSYRSIDRIYKLQAFMPLRRTLNVALLKGLSVDDVNIIRQNIIDDLGSNKYANELYVE